MTSIYQWINIILLVAVLGYVLRKKLGEHFTNQRKMLEETMNAASVEHKRIREKFDEIRTAVDSVDTKISQLKNFSLEEIENEVRRIEGETARAIEKFSEDSEARLQNETERMKKVLERELFQAALVQAKEGLEKDIKSKTQDWVGQIVQGETAEKRGKYAS